MAASTRLLVMPEAVTAAVAVTATAQYKTAMVASTQLVDWPAMAARSSRLRWDREGRQEQPLIDAFRWP